MGGSKAYLRALVEELEAAGHLPQDTDIASYEELLSRLETGSGVMADAIDIPPMSMQEARASLDALRRQASDLPPAEDLATLFREMQAIAQREGRSLTDVSAALGLAAAKAGLEMGNVHVFDFYRDALGFVDDSMWLRGRAWATSAALQALPYYRDTNPDIVARSRRAVREVLADLDRS